MAKRLLRDWTDSEKVNHLDAESERFFTRLIMKADDHGCFHAHPKLLKSALFPLLDFSDESVLKWLENCEQVGLLQVYSSDNKNYLMINEFGQRLRSMKSSFPTPGGEVPTNVSDTPPEVEEEVEDEFEEEVEVIVSNLNEITGSSYRSKTKTTRKFIVARLKEKFIVDDFKNVIAVKFLEWGADQKMKHYLRPETLFGTKFESYLQQSKPKNEPIITTKPGTGGNNYQGNKTDIASLVGQARG